MTSNRWLLGGIVAALAILGTYARWPGIPDAAGTLAGSPLLPENFIEVGATDKDLRLWRAKEAVRHAELRIASQTTNRNGLETRATSIIGWSVPSALGAVALIANPNTAWLDRYAVTALVCLLAAAALGATALWPRRWNIVGHPPDVFMNGSEQSELAHQEVIASDYGLAIRENEQQLKQLGWLIRLAWLALAAAPLLTTAVVAWNYGQQMRAQSGQ